PVQVVLSHAAASASISSLVRYVTRLRWYRLGVIASTRPMVAACSGWRSAAQANRDRIAASRLLRVRGLLPRPCSRGSRNVAISGGVEVGDVELAGVLAGALGGEAEQQPPGVAVAGDGVAAGAALADEPVGEERLQGGSERGHRGAP